MTAVATSLIEKIEEMFRSLEIVMVDASTYPCTSGSQKSQAIIVVGYQPNLACFFTVRTEIEHCTFKFVIQGEMKDGTRKRVLGHTFRGFSDISRDARGHESLGGERQNGNYDFQINHCTHGSAEGKDAEASLETGRDFYFTFLERYRALLAPRFTGRTDLWFVAENSDEYRELEKRNGRYHSDNSRPFNLRVMQKFPEGFFAPEQKP